jgi:hypothetical protein
MNVIEKVFLGSILALSIAGPVQAQTQHRAIITGSNRRRRSR